MSNEELIEWLIERYISAEDNHSPWCGCEDHCSCAEIASAKTDTKCETLQEVAEKLGVSYNDFIKKVRDKQKNP